MEQNIQEKIAALRKKQADFEKQGDLSKATHCKIICQFLEEFVA